uniref:Uncharacterized protein n=1 Tax=Salix viminalis TaxID=40686 RepID=A0A6N2N3Y4_SALVM
MGIVEEEDGVLKLVHPGRYVEIHIQPIAAAQVLENNPRHSITRLDVFEYPWIVVKQSLPITSCMGTVFQEQDCDKRIRNPPGKSAGMSPNQHQSLPITSWIVTSFQEQDCDKRDTKPAKHKPQEDSTSEIRPSDYEEYRFIKTNTTAGFPRKNDSGLDYNCMEEVINLRPCLRKQDSARKLFQLKVSFNLPVKDEEQRRAVHTTRAEVSGNCSCSSSEIFVHFTNLVSA